MAELEAQNRLLEKQRAKTEKALTDEKRGKGRAVLYADLFVFRLIGTLSLLEKEVRVRPGTTGLPMGTEYFGVGSSTWLCPTSFVSTRIGVELVDGLEN